MAQKTIQGFIVHETWAGHTEGEFKFSSNEPISTEHCTRINVCPHELTFDVPDDFDPRPVQLEALRKKKREAAAAYHAMVKELDERINSLLAIEMSA